MGHSDLRTTQRCINEAKTYEDEGTFGEPFPPLDVAALTAVEWAAEGAGVSDRRPAHRKTNVDEFRTALMEAA